MHGVTTWPATDGDKGRPRLGSQGRTQQGLWRLYLLGVPEDSFERRQRWWMAGPFVVAVLAAMLLGDRPSDLSGLTIAVAAAWAALYACVPLSGVRIVVALVGVAFLCWGVVFVSEGVAWRWDLLDGGHRPGRSAVAAVIGVLALLVVAVRDVSQLRALPQRVAADGSSENIPAAYTDGPPVVDVGAGRSAQATGTGGEPPRKRRADGGAQLSFIVVGVVAGLLLARWWLPGSPRPSGTCDISSGDRRAGSI